MKLLQWYKVRRERNRIMSECEDWSEALVLYNVESRLWDEALWERLGLAGMLIILVVGGTRG